MHHCLGEIYALRLFSLYTIILACLDFSVFEFFYRFSTIQIEHRLD